MAPYEGDSTTSNTPGLFCNNTAAAAVATFNPGPGVSDYARSKPARGAMPRPRKRDMWRTVP
jgi:hypothetical protein